MSPMSCLGGIVFNLGSRVEVKLLLSGVQEPLLMTGRGPFPPQLYNLEPESGMDECLSIDLDLHQLEKE